jgi:glucose/arabinose dehydrogenase
MKVLQPLELMHQRNVDSRYGWVACFVSVWLAGCGSDTTLLAGDLYRGDSPLAIVPQPLEEGTWSVAPDFQLDAVASGFQLPVGIAFVPQPGPDPDDPLFYVLELYGSIKTVRRSGVVSDYATGLLNFDPLGQFSGSGSHGLGGAAVDPANGDLYVTLTYSSTPGVASAVHHAAVERFTSADGGLTGVMRTRIASLAPEAVGPNRSISSLSFGLDGFLYVHMSDGAVAASARDLSQFRGKILRMNKSGAVSLRNPYYDTWDGISARDYVYASGLSNPVGGAWRISDRSYFFVERGPNVDRFARLTLGRSYGYDGSDTSMSDFALYNWNPATTVSSVAFVQREVFGGSGFPAEYQGLAYVTQSGPAAELGPGDAERKSITEWQIDTRGNLVEGARPIAYYTGEGPATVVAIAAGPDGLYFSDFYSDDLAAGPLARGASILRLRHSSDQAPVDCNVNGVPDQDDIGLGDDCNTNGIPDECDIASARSADCDASGLPDECEVPKRQVVDFSRGVESFTLNGGAEWVDGAIRLTPVTGGIGSALRTLPSSERLDGLRVQFDFRIGHGTGADGLSLVAFDAARFPETQLFGEDGVYEDLAVKLNTYDNGDGANNVQLLFGGQTLGTYAPSFSLRDGALHTARVLIDAGRVTVLVSSASGAFETAFEDLPLTGNVSFPIRLGFGARTGGFTDEHWVDNVELWRAAVNDRNDSGIPDVCECPSDVDDGTDTGTADGRTTVDDALYYIELHASGASAADLDDGSGDGSPDGVIDDDDLSYFFQRFQAGC